MNFGYFGCQVLSSAPRCFVMCVSNEKMFFTSSPYEFTHLKSSGLDIAAWCCSHRWHDGDGTQVYIYIYIYIYIHIYIYIYIYIYIHIYIYIYILHIHIHINIYIIKSPMILWLVVATHHKQIKKNQGGYGSKLCKKYK
jgi:hypothetical protein